MANKTVFGRAQRGRTVTPADTKNKAGGLAYAVTPEHALAQLACTGTFNDTFYSKAVDQLEAVRKAADQCSPEYVAKCAVYAREKGYMKDMPAALAVMLSKADPALLDLIFDRVIDNGKQLRNFVQFIRSGAFGRKSLGSGPKRLVKRWFAKRPDHSIFRASVGNDPSLGDIIKLARPKPDDVLRYPNEKDTREAVLRVEERRALYAYLIGRDHEVGALPKAVRDYQAWKKGDRSSGVPNVDFRMLTSLPLTKEDWAEIAKRGYWHQTRMNLNTYTRQGVFEITGMESVIAGKLKDADAIRKARVFPYQLLAAYVNTGEIRPHLLQGYYGQHFLQMERAKPQPPAPARVRLALQDALEIAVENVPVFKGRVAVIVDTSGSMGSPVTGHREGATTKVSCVDVAALVGATVMRKNALAVVIPVDVQVHSTDFINPRDSIMTNAARLATLGGGGTRLGAAMQHIERLGPTIPDLIIVVSDNESWVGDASRFRSRGTETLASFRRLKARNPNLKMVNIDIQAGTTSQTPCKDEPAILNVGGFSDQIWGTIARFVENAGPEQWVNEIKAVELRPQPAGETRA